jgi:hypothetical protein
VKAKLLEQFKNSPSETVSNARISGGQIHTDFFKCIQEPRMPEYIIKSLNCIDPYTMRFLREMSEHLTTPLGNENMGVTSAWFQKQEENMLHGIHNHGAVGFSSICYVKFDKDVHLPTTFISPFNDFLFGNTQYYQPEVEEGDIIFFPSIIQHYSPTNSSDSDRIIFSFNLK